MCRPGPRSPEMVRFDLGGSTQLDHGSSLVGHRDSDAALKHNEPQRPDFPASTVPNIDPCLLPWVPSTQQFPHQAPVSLTYLPTSEPQSYLG